MTSTSFTIVSASQAVINAENAAIERIMMDAMILFFFIVLNIEFSLVRWTKLVLVINIELTSWIASLLIQQISGNLV